MTPDRPDLADRLTETAARIPERVALRWQGRAITYGDLDARVTAAAAGLHWIGIERGDRVAVMLGNTPHFVEAFLGILRVGATVVPLNPCLAPPEVEHILHDSGARILVTTATIADALPELGVQVLRPDAWRDLLAAGHPLPDVERVPDDLAALVYTSGTTGRPKGAMLTRRNLDANQRQALDTPVGLREDDVVLAVLPMFHIYAMNVGLGCAVRVGATLLLHERFDPLSTLEDIERNGVTVILGAPPMYVAWLNTPGLADTDLSSVRVAVSGAAPLPANVLTRFREDHGLTIWEGYGLTEASPAVTSNAMGDVTKPGSVGKPLPEIELRLVGEDRGDVEPGDPGEVWIRGPNVFAGYWRDDEATAEVLVDGWLRTGDVGTLDDDGYLRLVDRKKDLIIVSGFNVYPREVEDVLEAHPSVLQAAVVGIAHPYTGEAVKAIVVAAPDSDLTEDELVDHARRHLARFKCPEIVEFVTALPSTATGKVLRRELRAAS